MFTLELPPLRHQHHGIERTLAAPRRAGRVCTGAAKAELGGEQRAGTAGAPRHAEIVAHVCKEGDIGVLEEPRAHEEGLARHLLFRDARPEQQGAVDLVTLHKLLHHDGGDNVDRLAGIVSFAVAGTAAYHRIAVAHSGFVAGLWDAVHVGAKGDFRLPGSVAPSRRPCGRNAGHALLNFEAFLLQQRGDVALRFVFLEAQLLEGEEHIHNFLHLFRAGLHHLERFGFELVEPRVGDGRGGGRRGGGGRGRGGPLRVQRRRRRDAGGGESDDEGTGGANECAKAGRIHGGLPRVVGGSGTAFTRAPDHLRAAGEPRSYVHATETARAGRPYVTPVPWLVLPFFLL